ENVIVAALPIDHVDGIAARKLVIAGAALDVRRHVDGAENDGVRPALCIDIDRADTSALVVGHFSVVVQAEYMFARGVKNFLAEDDGIDRIGADNRQRAAGRVISDREESTRLKKIKKHFHFFLT